MGISSEVMGLSGVCGDNPFLSLVFLLEFLFHNALTTCVYTITSWNVTFYM